MLSPLQSWHGLPLMPTSAPRPPQAQQQASPPAPAEGDGPLNLSKPKGSGSSGGSSSGRSPVMTSLNGNGTRSPPCPGQASLDPSRNVPPGLVLPPTFMPFATFPMSSGKCFRQILFAFQLRLLLMIKIRVAGGLVQVTIMWHVDKIMDLMSLILTIFFFL